MYLFVPHTVYFNKHCIKGAEKYLFIFFFNFVSFSTWCRFLYPEFKTFRSSQNDLYKRNIKEFRSINQTLSN